MATLDRRSFLRRGTVAAAVTGLVASVPGASVLIGALESDGPAGETASADSVGAEASAGSLDEPLVAHIKDAEAGEISLFRGTREIVVRDSALASRLIRASR